MQCNQIFYEFRISTTEALADVLLVQQDRDKTENYSRGHRNLFQHYFKRLLNDLTMHPYYAHEE